jgi:transposase-like protein
MTSQPDTCHHCACDFCQGGLSPKEYAYRHGISTRTVFRWIREGRIVAKKLTPRTTRVYPRQHNSDTTRH